MDNVSLSVQCIYRCSDEGDEDVDGKEGNELPGGRERVDIA